MDNRGYDFYLVATKAFNIDNLKTTRNIFGVAQESALLLLPQDKPFPSIAKTSTCKRIESIDEFSELLLRIFSGMETKQTQTEIG